MKYRYIFSTFSTELLWHWSGVYHLTLALPPLYSDNHNYVTNVGLIVLFNESYVFILMGIPNKRHFYRLTEPKWPNQILIATWWRLQMEKFSALLALCAGNLPVTGEFRAQRPVTRSFDVFFDLRPNKRLSKQSRGWRFETPSRSLWRHCNVHEHRAVPGNVEASEVIQVSKCIRVFALYILVVVYCENHDIFVRFLRL